MTLWVRDWRRQATGDVIEVRYADDFIVGFQHEQEAERFRDELRERLAAYGLELHPDKTRLIEFGAKAASDRKRGGRGKPETFDFLGFTHICGKTRKGRFAVVRQTARKRVRAKLQGSKAALRYRWHHPVPEVGRWLASVIRGHIDYSRSRRGRWPQRLSTGDQAGSAASAAAGPRRRPTGPRHPLTLSEGRLLALLGGARNRRHSLSQGRESRAVMPRAGICAGGAGQPASLPQTSRPREPAGAGGGFAGQVPREKSICTQIEYVRRRGHGTAPRPVADAEIAPGRVTRRS